MYHIIKENDQNVLLCSGAMGEADYAMVKKEFGIDKHQVRFVPQFVISKIFELEPPLTEKLKTIINKMPRGGVD